MHRQRHSRPGQPARTRRRSYRPLVERIEERVAPGNLIGPAWLSSLGLFGDLLDLAAAGGKQAPPAGAAGPAKPGKLVAPSSALPAGGPEQAAPALEPGGGNTHAAPLPRSAADAVFADGLVGPDFAGDFLALPPDLALARGGDALLFALANAFNNRPEAGLGLPPSGPGEAPRPSASPVSPASNGANAAPGPANAALVQVAAAGAADGGASPGAPEAEAPVAAGAAAWLGFGHNPQHTGISPVKSRDLTDIAWQTPVDLDPQYTGEDLLIHYGSPLVTPANTVIVPVKTGATEGFRVEARNGSDGSLKWTATTDYLLPPHRWTPSYAPVLTPTGRLYFAGAGGTVYFRDGIDSPGPYVTGQFAFYGIENYTHAGFDSRVFVNTPITSDSAGNIYFGFEVTGTDPGPLGLQGGIARIDANGVGTWISAADAGGNPALVKVAHNSAPALSNDGRTLYVAVNTGTGTGFGQGFLVALDSTTLAPQARVLLRDPVSGNNSLLPDDGTASPTVGPDGDVYFGVLENPFASSKGWLLHFSGDLSQVRTPGAFGWDDTASIVPRSMVPSYQGSSPYLLMTKYNNYAELGGDGVNLLAILDPNDTQIDARTGATVMKEVLTIAGPTPDKEFIDKGFPDAVREWCINTAAVDPFTNSVLANSEDGKLYRWDLTTNTFTQVVTLTEGIGEAYTPVLVGVDGTVYAINNAILFAVR